MHTKVERNLALDNLRALMIICVVAGHLLEVLAFSYSRYLYVMIYSFHMPVLVFISGMFSKLDKKSPERILRGCIYPYLIFQTLYLLFSNFVLREPIDYHYTTPYWLLWYLLAMAIWQVMLWGYSAIRSKGLAFGISVAVSLIIGFESSIGYYGSLSRAFVLFPFYLGGYIMAKNRRFAEGEAMQSLKARAAAVCVGVLLSVILFAWTPNVLNRMLYHSYPYNQGYFHAGHRALMLAIGGMWIGVLFTLVPRKRIPWLTYCGQNTMTVFVLHGFILRLLKKYLSYIQLKRSWTVFLLLTVLIPVVLSSPPVVKAYKTILNYPFRAKQQQKQ